MTLDGWASVAEIVGAFAVVVTLIYLALQVRQSTTSTKANAYQNWLAVHDSVISSFDDLRLSEIINQGMLDSRNLTEENYVWFISWLRRYLYMQQAQFDLYKKGVVDEELWECNLNDLMGVFRFPGVQQYWEAGAKEHFTSQFVKVVENSETFSPMFLWSKEKGFYPTPHHKK